jgi:branched-chain amino acid transport system substrate-binding protein
MTVACGGSGTPSGSSATPYRVLVLAGFSGFTSGQAAAQMSAYKAAAAVLNRSGGILSHKIEIETIDTQADPTKAVSLLIERLGNGPKPDLVIPGTSSSETLAILPTLTQNKILAFSLAASAKVNDPGNYPYYFSMSVTPTIYATSLVQYAQKQGYKKAALIGANDANGASGVQALVDAAKIAGLQTVTAFFPALALDISPQLDQLKSQSPDVLLYRANGTQVAALLKGRTKLGWTIPTIADLASGANDIWQLAGSDASGTSEQLFAVQRYVAPAQRPKPLVELFTELQKLGVPPYTSGLTVYALAWDILQLANTAATQSNSVAGAKVADALENLKQPSSPPWIVFKTEGYSKTVHFLEPPPTEFQVLNCGPSVDGMVKSA